MKKSFTIIFLFACLVAPAFVFASSYVLRQVIVLNEGPFGGPVTVGTYDPVSKVYANFDTIPAQFATDVLIDNGFIYVAADTLIVKYDLITKQVLHQQTVKGVREMAIYNNQLLVSRGDISPLPSYFQAYNKNDLSFMYEITTLSGAGAEMKVLNDTAYVAVNNFGTMGKLAVVDLTNHSLNREVDLGANGLNPETVGIYGNKVYTMSAPNWTNSAVTEYDAGTTAATTNLLNTTSGCSGSSIYRSDIYFQVSAEPKLRLYSVLSTSIWDSLPTNQTAYGLGIDSVNARIYEGLTDFSTYGKVYIYDFYGALRDSFNVNVSPGTFAFDVVNTTGIDQSPASVETVNVYPNPVSGEIYFSLPSNENEASKATLTDVSGRVIGTRKYPSSTKNSFNVEGIAPGIYFLKIETVNGNTVKKIIKN